MARLIYSAIVAKIVFSATLTSVSSVRTRIEQNFAAVRKRCCLPQVPPQVSVITPRMREADRCARIGYLTVDRSRPEVDARLRVGCRVPELGHLAIADMADISDRNLDRLAPAGGR